MMKRGDISFSQLRNELHVSLERNRDLEKEIEKLKEELLHLKLQIPSHRPQVDEKLKEELLHLKLQIPSHQPQVDEKKSLLQKKSLSSIISNSASHVKQARSNNAKESLAVDGLISRKKFLDWTTTKMMPPRVPQPPPRPKYFPSAPNLSRKEALFSSPPPPPPPPPPPLQSRSMLSSAVHRVPEVVELYRSLTRKNGNTNPITSTPGTLAPMNSREMIGEIENRSAYLLAVKSDVLNQGEFINFLSREVTDAAFREISDVGNFVKWLDEELSHLVDERAVLRHFPQWPEQKADAMREATFNYRDLKNLVSEISSFQNNICQPTPAALKVIQALQDKLEHSVHNLEKLRDCSSKRYRDFKIPWQWMHNSGIITQLKLGSVHLAKMYMRRVMTALQSDAWSDEQELLLQGVRFAFRVHQFVGGFDEESRHTFQELQKLANCSCTLYQPEE